MNWQVLYFVFEVDEVVINDKDPHVEKMERTSNHMPSPSELFPLEFNAFLDGV